MNPKEFHDKTILITGGAAGIGEATAYLFARHGASVVVSDIDEERGKKVAETIVSEGGEAIFVRTDVARKEELETLVSTTIATYGALDFAFNNAGIEGKMGLMHKYEDEVFERLIDINLKGVYYAMRYQISHMLKADGGVIINNSSIAGLKGFAGGAAYAASKHAVVGLTKAAALEYADKGLRINAVCPGVIDTEMIDRAAGFDESAKAAFVEMEPVKRMGKPMEVAELVAFLCSERAAFITGAAIPIDGGVMAG